MEFENKFYCTKFVELGSKKMCAYCGKPIREYIDSWKNLSYAHCDCEDAKKEREIELEVSRKREQVEDEILEMYKQLPKVKYKVELTKISD